VATTMNVYEAKSHFSELLSRAEAGEEIIIARHGKPIVQLVPVQRKRPDRVAGLARGQIWIADDFDDFTAEDEEMWFASDDEPETA
jgi:prevent-host-death family protein